MKTLFLNKDETLKAAEILKSGGLVAIPTETVYGLAANAFDEKAIKQIFTVKGRPSDNPLIVHISAVEEVYDIVSDFTFNAQRLAQKFWPGPLTMILRKKDNIPSIVSAGLLSVAVRFPAHKVAQKIIRQTGVPLVAPSANLSGKPSPTKFNHVVNDLNGKIDAILDGGDCSVGLESTVVSFEGGIVKILRPGAISFDDLKSTVKNVEIDKSVYEKLDVGSKVISPGTKYKHYSPDADVFAVNGTSEKYAEFVNSKKAVGVYALCFDEDIPFLKMPYISYGGMGNFNQQAHNLFDALRKFDKLKAKVIYAHFTQTDGMAMAVYNRLIRAAGFKIINI